MSEEIKNKLFWVGVLGMIFFSIAFAWYRYVVALDYTVLFHTSCDPTQESCFLFSCDPTQENAECSADPREDGSFYALRKVKAYRIAECSEGFMACVDAICAKPESKCVRSTCNPKVFDEENGECYGPDMTREEVDQYVVEPSEENSSEGDIFPGAAADSEKDRTVFPEVNESDTKAPAEKS